MFFNLGAINIIPEETARVRILLGFFKFIAKEKVKPYVEKTMEKERGSGDLFMVQSFIQQKFLMKQSTES